MNWKAPESGSGCITFRATIIENRDVWYMDAGQLTKDICEDEEAQEDFISNVLEECTACHEAKYEVCAHNNTTWLHVSAESRICQRSTILMFSVFLSFLVVI